MGALGEYADAIRVLRAARKRFPESSRRRAAELGRLLPEGLTRDSKALMSVAADRPSDGALALVAAKYGVGVSHLRDELTRIRAQYRSLRALGKLAGRGPNAQGELAGSP
jgi:hypothetical protein